MNTEKYSSLSKLWFHFTQSRETNTEEVLTVKFVISLVFENQQSWLILDLHILKKNK
jgi:hypothetical protein